MCQESGPPPVRLTPLMHLLRNKIRKRSRLIWVYSPHTLFRIISTPSFLEIPTRSFLSFLTEKYFYRAREQEDHVCPTVHFEKGMQKDRGRRRPDQRGLYRAASPCRLVRILPVRRLSRSSSSRSFRCRLSTDRAGCMVAGVPVRGEIYVGANDARRGSSGKIAHSEGEPSRCVE